MTIRYCTYDAIDKAKWDACIDRAPNGLLYAYSVYLDAMAKHWDALVLGDYEAVMPLTWNRKYGICYLYQPPFTACLGVFGKTVDAGILKAFLEAIPAKFRYWDISLNPGNVFPVNGFRLHERMNYVLSLNDTYEQLYGRFRENIRRNIKKAEQYALIARRNIPVEKVLDLARQQIRNFADVPDDAFRHFEDLYQVLYKQERATTYGVYGKDDTLLASAVFLFSHNRAYYILVGNHPNGKTLGASHILINAFIKDHAGQHVLLDFEGSDIPGLAFFYNSFGAQEEKYSALKMNRLPLWLKWLKN